MSLYLLYDEVYFLFFFLIPTCNVELYCRFLIRFKSLSLKVFRLSVLVFMMNFKILQNNLNYNTVIFSVVNFENV